MDRRRFVKSASWGAAGCLLTSVASSGQDHPARPESPVIPQTAWGRVWIRWTEPALPAEILLAHGLVLPWEAPPALVETATKQGYRVYAAVTLEQAAEAPNSSRARGFLGMVLGGGDAGQGSAEKIARNLQRAYPHFTILSPDAGDQSTYGRQVVPDRKSVV